MPNLPQADSQLSISNRCIFASLPRTVRGKPLVLHCDPKGQNFIYTHGNSVFIRNLDDPLICDVYTQHSTAVQVAKYSPSGYYIASADVSGKVRIWDTVNAEHILKYEYQPISGPINDLAWSPDNQRMICVGQGQNMFAHAFLVDTGTSNGDLSIHTQLVNSCDYRPIRPFRVITGSEDKTVGVFEGPPFKYKERKRDHERYCQAVRYSPNGSVWASGGFDGKLFLYHGQDSQLLGELKSNFAAHDGGIYAIAWAPDNKRLLSASGDKTCKLWDVETKTMISEFKIGSEIEDQQLGCLWSCNGHLASVSLSGRINFLDVNNPSNLIRFIEGHTKPITALETFYGGNTLCTGSSDGRIIEWSVGSGSGHIVGSEADLKTKIISLRADGKLLYTLCMDDTLRCLDENGNFCPKYKHKFNSQPQSMDLFNDECLITVTMDELLVLNKSDASVVLVNKLGFSPSCVSVLSDRKHIAIGEANKSPGVVHLFELNGTGSNLTMCSLATAVLSVLGPVMDVAYSPDGKYLVVADGNRRVTLFTVADQEYFRTFPQIEWGFHNAKVNCVAWSPNSQWVASGGLDCALILWSLKDPKAHVIVRSAHCQSQITSVRWLDDACVVTTGQDGNTKLWNVNCP